MSSLYCIGLLETVPNNIHNGFVLGEEQEGCALYTHWLYSGEKVMKALPTTTREGPKLSYEAVQKTRPEPKAQRPGVREGI